MGSRQVPAREARAEIRVANSRFIAAAAPVFSVDEARAFIARIKSEFPDAVHHVPAYLIGHEPAVIAHCTDDREPSGTAGRPTLAVLRGSGLGDVAVVVTRYFGGTKLGTGGLVRAYGDATREVLAVLPRAVKTSAHTVMMVAPYSLFERLRRAIIANQGTIVEQDFAADVTIVAQLAEERFPQFRSAVRQLSGDTIQVEIVKANLTVTVPIAPSATE
jgi:uncharacterized YigZ family protein